MKKTKTICTIGPSTDSLEKIKQLIKSGMNVARLNMSHGSLSSHQATLNNVKMAREELNVPCAIMVDTCGPELRIGDFIDGVTVLKRGQLFSFRTKECMGDNEGVYCGYPALLKVLKPKQKLYANNGLLEFAVDKVTKTDIVCKVLIGGEISSHKSISIPHIRLPLPFINEKDSENIKFAVKNDVEYISASFVNCAQDVNEMRKLITKLGGRQKIISKIESAEGVKNLDEIIAVSDGIMVARGDLGTEVPIEQIPFLQKKMIQKSIEAGKKVIVATEMLESMTQKRRPTRAETTDVAQAIYDRTGATMLSGETASGLYPIESAETMDKIVKAAEEVVEYENLLSKTDINPKQALEAIAYSACVTANVINAKAIVCFTHKGKTALTISKFRPQAPIIAITHDNFTYESMALAWGVEPVVLKEQKNIEKMFLSAQDIVKELKLAKKGDKIVITLGLPADANGLTNAITIYEIK